MRQKFFCKGVPVASHTSASRRDDDVDVYLDTAVVLAGLIDSQSVAECWEDPSVLQGMRVAGLSDTPGS